MDIVETSTAFLPDALEISDMVSFFVKLYFIWYYNIIGV